jgi:hypothetical protein
LKHGWMRIQSRFLLTASLLLLAGLTACQKFGSGVAFTVDNPTGQTLQVSLDGKAITLAPHSGQDISLAPGAHTLEAPATGKVPFLVYVRGRGGLINPTLSPYITVNEIYATDAKGAERFRPFHKAISLDGVTFSGPFSVDDSLFIEKTWRFGVHEKLPDTILVGPDSKGNIQGKVYDLEAFVAYDEAATSQPGRFARERKPEPPKAFTLPIPAIPVPSGPPEWDAQTAPLRAAAHRYLNAATAAEQQALQKEFQQGMIAIATYNAKTAYKLGGEENKRRDAEFRALIDAFSHSAVALPR